MHIKVNSVAAKDNFTLDVVFNTGERRLYDMKPLLSRFPTFRTLVEVKGLFPLVKIDCGGYGISWNDDLDLDAYELYSEGKEV